MSFMRRSADYRHQVLEISSPVPMGGQTGEAFGRCTAAVSTAISRSPAHWAYFASTADLASLGLMPAERDQSPIPEMFPLHRRRLRHDRTADHVATPG
jgi:hypothetical protein